MFRPLNISMGPSPARAAAAAAAAVTVGWRRHQLWREWSDRTEEEGMVARGWRGWMGDRG